MLKGALIKVNVELKRDITSANVNKTVNNNKLALIIAFLDLLKYLNYDRAPIKQDFMLVWCKSCFLLPK